MGLSTDAHLLLCFPLYLRDEKSRNHVRYFPWAPRSPCKPCLPARRTHARFRRQRSHRILSFFSSSDGRHASLCLPVHHLPSPAEGSVMAGVVSCSPLKSVAGALCWLWTPNITNLNHRAHSDFSPAALQGLWIPSSLNCIPFCLRCLDLHLGWHPGWWKREESCPRPPSSKWEDWESYQVRLILGPALFLLKNL